MRYVCPICGYVYDEGKEGVPFSALPDSWTCPLCGAAKAVFAPEQPAAPAPPPAPAPLPLEQGPEELSPGVLAALFSNLARGCEKQYQAKEQALFAEIAAFFQASTPAVPDAGVAALAAMLREDVQSVYPALAATASEAGDRGTQRVRVWGEKVTRMLQSLVDRYEREGEAFLRDTHIWVCSVCGFVYVGDRPPELCPVCKVPAWKFDKVEGRASR